MTYRHSFDPSLLLIADKSFFRDKEALFFARIQAAVKGGVTCVQFRDYESDLERTIETAHQLKKMLNGVPLLINTLNSFEVIRAVGAEGVFLENDFSHAKARKLLGNKGIIGTFVQRMEDIVALERTTKIDFISVKIATCCRNDITLGMEGLYQMLASTSLLAIAVGGINLSTVEPVYRLLGSRGGVGVARGLMNAEDPEIIAKKIQAIRQKVMEAQ